MSDGAADHVEMSAGGAGDHDEIVNEREAETLPDDAHRLPAQADGERDFFKIVGHQRNVGGFVRDIGTGNAHRDADIGNRERGGVVDAVADHCDAATADAVLKRGDLFGFLFRQDFGFDFVHAEGFSDLEGNAAVVAGKEDDFFEAEGAEIGNGFPGGGANGVGDANRSANLAVVRDDDGGVSGIMMLGDVGVKGVGDGDVLVGEQ